jgi:fumarate reductase subunit D
MGLIVTVIGMAVIFLSAIGYLIFGNAVAGIIGIIFVALIAYFLRRGWNATDQQSRQLAAFTPFIIGWIIMIPAVPTTCRFYAIHHRLDYNDP